MRAAETAGMVAEAAGTVATVDMGTASLPVQ